MASMSANTEPWRPEREIAVGASGPCTDYASGMTTNAPAQKMSMTAVLMLLLFILLSAAVASTGAMFQPDAWYLELAKPSWTPPDWVFGPVWALLYLLMAIAAWLVWYPAGWSRSRVPLMLYGVQLAFNAAWSWLFFGLHRIDLGFLDIMALWFALLATTLAFYRVRKLAGLLLLPYLAWVAYAGALNLAIWRLNL
jgi:benzodiazapine receptor